ncbi:MAG: hypothetical protein AAF226_02130 [Verrucomicrobiota bacterium]
MSAAEALEKKIVFDSDGEPSQVVIPYDKFIEFIETYGLDLTPEELDSVREAQKDIEQGATDAFISHSEFRKSLECTS